MYDSSEVNSPLLFTGHWDQCHGLLSKIFFTIPMQGSAGGQWTPQNLPSGSVDSLNALAAFVRAAVQGAYMTSPLFPCTAASVVGMAMEVFASLRQKSPVLFRKSHMDSLGSPVTSLC